MNDELVSYVKNQLSEGKEVSVIIGALKEKGWKEADINQAFQKAVQSSAAEPQSSEKETKIQKQAVHKAWSTIDFHNFDATKAFVTIGAILIVIAVIIVIYSQWSNVGPWARIMFLLIPMLALFTISSVLAKREQFHYEHAATLAIGCFMLPFTIGTFLYQTAVIGEISPSLVLTSVLISLPIYVILEFVFGKRYLAIFTAASIYVAYTALAIQIQWEVLPSFWGAFLISLIIAGVGAVLAARKQVNGNIYSVIGTLGSLALFPSCILSTLNNTQSLDYNTNLVIVSLFGILYLAIASMYNSFRFYFKNEIFYSIKRVLEEIAPIVILTPYVAISFNEHAFAPLALVLSIAFILASIKVWIQSLPFVGSLGLIVSLLTITGEYFADSVGWPVIVFIAGFAAIGIGLLIRKLTGLHKDSEHQEMFLGLGKDPQIAAMGGAKKIGCVGIVLILILIYLAYMFFGRMIYY